ncbi:MAG TPA: AAA family ATPase, partial [Candidatus Limnocylindria bacterium]
MTADAPTDVGRQAAAFFDDLRAAVATAVVGAPDALRLLAVTLLADGHALIEDVPGVGKTLLARAVARAIGLSFARVQGTPDLLPGDVTGSSILEGKAFRFVPGPIFSQVVLVDEINRATPRTQSALLEAMQERQASVDGVTRPLP